MMPKKYIDADALRKKILNTRFAVCYDLPWNRWWIKKSIGVVNKILEIIKEFPSADVEEGKRAAWISVKDRLPNLGMEVLVLIGADMFVMALARKDQETADIEWVDAHGYIAEMWEVTHWMPLPEPPEVEG